MTISELRGQWPRDTRVELTAHGGGVVNLLRAVPVGTHGTVTLVDAARTIHVDWDNGVSYGVSLDEGDMIVKVQR